MSGTDTRNSFDNSVWDVGCDRRTLRLRQRRAVRHRNAPHDNGLYGPASVRVNHREYLVWPIGYPAPSLSSEPVRLEGPATAPNPKRSAALAAAESLHAHLILVQLGGSDSGINKRCDRAFHDRHGRYGQKRLLEGKFRAYIAAHQNQTFAVRRVSRRRAASEQTELSERQAKAACRFAFLCDDGTGGNQPGQPAAAARAALHREARASLRSAYQSHH